jgi:D-3-phosphoglycerate dehydrogenase
MKVVLLDSQIIKGYDYSIEQKIIEDAGFTFVKETCTNEDDIIAKCSDADAILNITLNMTEKSISKLDNCKIMIRYGIGVNEFDFDAANKKGIQIANCTTYCLPEVAIHATSLLLALSRNLKHYDIVVSQGKWNQAPGTMERRATSQTLALVGFGNIARNIAKNMQGLGYNVAAYDPYVSDDVFKNLGVQKLSSLDEVYAQADMISLHLPETNETKHMLNKESFAKMKDGVILVNCSRGGLINTNDLVEALDSGKVGSAGLDVLEIEPMTDTSFALLNRNNVIITPHFAYRSKEANQELFKQVAETAVSSLKGNLPENVLNKKELGL